MTRVNERETAAIGITIGLLMRGPLALPILQSWLLSHYGVAITESDVILAKMEEIGYTKTIGDIVHITNEEVSYEPEDNDEDNDYDWDDWDY